MAESKEPIVRRYEKNPILTKHDVPYPVETVHNAGVVKHNGKYVMLFRSHLRNGRSIIGLAESSDGVRFAVRPEPFITPAKAQPFAEYEAFGVEDPRICPMEDGYLVTPTRLFPTRRTGGPGQNHGFRAPGTDLPDHPGGLSQRGHFP